MKALRNLFAAGLLAISLTALPACLPQADATLRDARTVSNSAALVIETAQSAAELLYNAQQLAAVSRAAAVPGATSESVTAAVSVVRAQWAPVIQLFAEARALHQQLVEALDKTQDVQRVSALMAELWKKEQAISKQMELLRGAP